MPVQPADIQAHVARITCSPVFSNSERLRELLQYTVTGALGGRGTSLKGSVLGVAVFGRKADCDSDANSVVRVEFALLRNKLQQYYDSEGAGESWRIVFPKGSYAPEFVRKEAAAPPAFAGSVVVLPFTSRGQRQVHLSNADRLMWVCLSRLWTRWRSALVIIQPETVIRWHRKGFRLYWTWKSRHARPGRPDTSREVRDLIRKMSLANPLWGAPRIHGELLKLGIELSQATVAKYMVRHRKPPSQTWRTFLDSHLKQLVSTDFFVVPTVNFRILFVFVVLAHHRRRVVYFNVTEHPTAAWTARQIVQAFPWDTAPRYLIRDRDSIYGEDFRQQVRAMGIHQVLTAPRSPWQNAYAERLVGSIRRECLDHVMVFNESSLRRTLKSYFDYYHGVRTHLSLEKDAPETRLVQPPELGSVVELPEVGGLHHCYVRRAA